MSVNYTPLKIPKRKARKLIFLNFFSGFFFTASFLFFFFNVIIPNFSDFFSQKARAENKNREKNFFKRYYQSFDEINFIPRRINKIEIKKDDIYTYYKKKYPELKEDDLIKVVNKKIFSFYILNKNNKDNLKLLTEKFNGDVFEEEVSSLIDNYKKNTKKIDFYYFKVRYEGIFDKNLKSLKIEPYETKQKAEEKISYYLNLNIPPDLLLTRISQDKEVALLNNEERASEYIKDYDHSTPLFDDPDFYNFLTESPLNNYSRIYNLKTKNPFSPEYQNYLFVLFYVNKIEGENNPLDLEINNFVSKADFF